MPMHLYAFDRHRSEDPWAEAPAWALELREMLGLIINQEKTTMAAIDDLNNAVTSLATGFGALDAAVHAELTALVAAQAAGNDAAITQAVANISQITGQMATDAQALTASIPAATTAPAPPTLPVPTPVAPTVEPPAIATPPVTAAAATPPSTPPMSATTTS
jgi:hypothetical protein